MKTIQQLIQNTIGQLEGIKKMDERGEDCLKILTQLKAVRSALGSLGGKMLIANLKKCSSLNSPKKKKEFEKIVTELSKI
ncbi:metal-sensing transcriptional repressor [Candidatus Gracilibacteria bacterium]|nr:metal-sensing transcriptional repressor [Candidatus Gracilibacteria bacterium]MCF7855947.1 metal-sensing transcriptional repressor [Candidatus Gracilibacteria bacterium]MCF7896360.1 metal-sensing transcriptional repressor [Candidatus Gracilibacteria bacterium]